MTRPRSGVEISPAVLIWARESAGYDLDDAASELRVAPDLLQQFEAGDARPNMGQLDSMARVYRRAFTVLLTELPPDEPADPEDFRTVGGYDVRKGPETRFAFRDARRWQSAAARLAHSTDQQIELSLPRVTESADIDDVAGDVTRRLNISWGTRGQWRDAGVAWSWWRDAVESTGVLVFTRPMKRHECRGFSLVEGNPAPVIVVNNDEIPQARIFTLLHELGHVLLRRSGICDQLLVGASLSNVESWCNRLSAAVIYPEDRFHAEFSNLRLEGHTLRATFERLARTFKASRPSAALRAESLNLVPPGTYDDLRAGWEREGWRVTRPGSGGPSPALTFVAHHGRRLASLLVEAVSSGALSKGQAVEQLDMSTRMYDRVAERINAG